MNKHDAIIVDIDGTLCYHPAYADLRDDNWCWEHFGELVKDAECNEFLAGIMGFYQTVSREVTWGGPPVDIILLTARPWFLQEQTVQWLNDYNVPYNYLVMSGPDAYQCFEEARKDGYEGVKLAQAKYKVDHIHEFRQKGYNIIAAFEDNSTMAEAMRDVGVPIYQVKFKGNPHG